MSISRFELKKQSVLAHLHGLIHEVEAINFGDYELLVDKFQQEDEPENTALFVLFHISEKQANHV